MRSFFTFIIIVALIAVAVFGYVFWRSYSSLSGAESTLDGRLNAVIAYYASLDRQYVTPLKALPELPPETAVALEVIYEALLPLSKPPAAYDARLGVLMESQKTIRRFTLSPGLPPVLTTSTVFADFNKNTSNLGRASALLKECNDAVAAYNARLLSRSGKLIGQWSSREAKQYLSIDGTLSNDTVIMFN
ncbi:MAG: hypothetical protein PHZ00_01495 [Candidatus Peribacteraceae bacterium]|nr:hypothetical protein [Candidatus Peribacteraceae bacterium]